jgi:cell division FtsZ-interacting protein ZapD
MPDFFCYRTKPDGSTEIQFVEAKADDDPIRPNQKLVISLLRQSGVTVKILRNTGFYEWFYADEGRRVQLTTLTGIPFREAQISYVKNPPKRSEDDL